jgi:hypothetical protein
MTCLHCGTPLSPFYTSCPRCGAAIEGEIAGQVPQQASAMAFSPRNAFQGLTSQDNLAQHIDASQYQWGAQATPAPREAQGWLFAQPTAAYQQAQYTAQGQLAFPDNNPITPPPPQNTAQQAQSGAFTYTPQSASSAVEAAPVQVGFMLAGLCLVAGGLILVLVYVMSLSLPSA